MVRPLYGSRDAPLRWWLAIAAFLRKWGFAMLRSGCCVFVVFSTKGADEKWAKGEVGHVECLILLHVGDLLSIWSVAWKSVFLQAIKEYGHGDVDQLSTDNPITYCGMKICQSGDRIVSLSQKDVYPKLISLDSPAILEGGRFIINEANRRKLVKSFVGWCLWLVQCRYGLCFLVCQLASDVIDAIRCPENMKEFIADTRRALSRISEYHHDVCCRNF